MVIRVAEARDARCAVEAALDRVAAGACWPWLPRLSFWLDVLLTLQERAAR